MQKTFKRIFEIAKQEVPNKLFISGDCEAVFYRGFKISKNNNFYKWEDIRHNNFYSEVELSITENIFEKGFRNTLTEVMLFADKEKLVILNRKIEQINSIIKYWSGMSISLYHTYHRDMNYSEDISTTRQLQKKYLRNRELYSKKRQIILEDKLKTLEDYRFFEERIKMYKTINK